MTDFTSRETVFYSVDQYNNGTTNVDAQVDISLQYPLVQQGNNYNVGIAKAQFDLSTIPLTRTNIPLKTYQVALRQGAVEGSAYVRQIGATSNNYIYNLDPATGIFSKSTYSTSGVLTPVSTFQIPTSVAVGFGSMVIDNYENIIVATNLNGSKIYDTLTIISVDGIVISQTAYNGIVCLSLSPTQVLCVADNAVDGSIVNVYTLENSVGVVTLNLTGTITTNKAGETITDIKTVAVDAHILIGYNGTNCTLYETEDLTPLTDFQPATIPNISAPSAMLSSSNRFVLVDQGVTEEFIYGQSLENNNIIDVFSGDQLIPNGQYMSPSAPTVSPPYTNCFGIQNATGALISSTYEDGVFGQTPTVIQTGPAMQYSALYSDQKSIFGYTDENTTLCCLGLDNVSNTTWQIVCGQYIDGIKPILQTQFQPDTPGKAYAIESTNNLYSTDALFPKLLYTGLLQTETPSLIKKWGVSLNSPGLEVAPSVLSSSTPITVEGATTPLTIIGVSSDLTTGNYYALVADNVNKNYLLKLNPLTLAIETTTSVTTVDQCVSLFNIPGIGIAVSLLNDTTQYVMIYDHNSLDALIEPSAMAMGAGGNFNATTWKSGADSYVGAISGSQMNVWKVTVLNSIVQTYVDDNVIPTLITGLPAGSTLTTLNNIQGFQTGDYSGFLVGTSSASATYPDLLCTFAFTDATFSQLASVKVINIEQYSLQLLMSANINAGELYLGLATEDSIQTYSVNAAVVSGTINLGVNLGVFIYVPNQINGTFSWTQQPLSGVTGFTSFCFSNLNPNKIYGINTTDNLIYSGVVTSNPIVMTKLENQTITMASVGTAPGISGTNSTAYCYNLTGGQALVGTFNQPDEKIVSIGKDRISYGGQGEFIVSTYHNFLTSLAPAAFTQNWQLASPTAGLIYLKPGEDVYAGNYPVYDYGTLVTYINAALLEAYTNLVNAGGTGMIEAPSLSLDPVSVKLTLNYPAPYSQSGNGILFNNALLQICRFASTPDAIDIGMNLLTLVPNSSSATQFGKSIYLFNQLDQILLISNTIYVIGSLYADNLQNNILQDFTVPISDASGNQGVVLYVQPNFVSTLTIGSNQPIQRIQLRAMYKYKNGTVWPLLLAPDTNWTAKVMIIKKF